MVRHAALMTMATALVAFALFPVGVLMLASGLPGIAARPEGIALQDIAHWRGPRFALLWDAANASLWTSLLRTTGVALSVSLLASSLSITAAYLVTRRRARLWRNVAEFLSLAAYGLPSVFLLLALHPLLLRLPIEPLASVWLLHFLYVLPMCSILTLGYAASHPFVLDRSAAMDGAGWQARFALAYRANLWRGHLAVTCIGALISWGDIVFSQQLLSAPDKLLVDLYLLRYFQVDSTFPDYASAAMFSLVLTGIAVGLAFLIAMTSRRGA